MTTNTTQNPHKRIVLILGPTAGGKSDLAVTIATHFNAQIINADSMQVYRHLNAGTAKPTPQQLAAVPHHLVNIVEPTQPWSVADWLDAAESTITDLLTHQIIPILTGGTNLYIKALLQGMFDGPHSDPLFRASLTNLTNPQLHQRLQQIDPAAAQRIFPNDRKRITRALEVHHATGQTITSLQSQWSEDLARPYNHSPIIIAMRWSTPIINARINARVKAMFHPTDTTEDLVTETKRLLDNNLLGQQAAQALGTKQVIEYLNSDLTLDQTIEKVKIETRRFAKAQRTWLKRFRSVHWLDADNATTQSLAEIAIKIITDQLTIPTAT